MQIDLEPQEYRSQRSRRSAYAHGLAGAVGLIILSLIWWHRGEITLDTLFLGTTVFALPTGGFLMVFLNQWRGV